MLHSPHRRLGCRQAPLMSAAVATLFLAACSAGPQTTDSDRPPAVLSPRPAPKPVLTVTAAARTLDRYEEVNNAANKRQDKALLGRVEAGQLYQQSIADYEQWDTRSRSEQKKYEAAFHYVDRRYFAPAAGTASWFAVTARATPGAKGYTLMIFDRVDGAYKKVAAVHVDGNALPVSEIAVDKHGLATAADPSVRVGPLAPDQLGAAFTDLFETGGKNMGKQLAPTDAVKESVAFYRSRDKGPSGDEATLRYFAARPSHSKIYALRLSRGGVLAIVPTAHTTELMLKPQYRSSFQITPNEQESVYDRSKRAVVINTMQGQALAQLTPTGKPKILARKYRLVDSR